MKPVNRQTKSELEYAIKDCTEAIEVNSYNPKVYQYMAERTACIKELETRDRIKSARKRLTEVNDPLLTPVRSRWLVKNRNGQAYVKDQIRTGYFLIGSYRRYNLI